MGYLEGGAITKVNSRFPEGTTERSASATARATTKANTGILHYVQDDGGLVDGGLASDDGGLEGGGFALES